MCGLAISSNISHAQEQDAEKARQLEEIIVTASRREESMQDVGVAAVVIDIEDYANASKTNLQEILPFVSGVSFQYGGAGAYFVRRQWGCVVNHLQGAIPLQGYKIEMPGEGPM